MADIKVKLKLGGSEELVLDKASIKSIETTSQSTGDYNSIMYGVVPSAGNVKILDLNGSIKQDIISGKINTSSIPIEVYANGKLLQQHKSTNNNYDSESSLLIVDLGNSLSKWDSINFEGYPYPNKKETLFDMMVNTFSTIGIGVEAFKEMINGFCFNDRNEFVSIESYLKSIDVEYPYLPADDFRSTIDKFCRVAQLSVYENDDGEIIFSSARPLLPLNQSTVIIPKKQQVGSLQETILLKNKYDSVQLTNYCVKDEIDYGTPVYSFETPVYESNPEIAVDTDELNTSGVGFSVSEDAISRVEAYYNDGTVSISKYSNLNLSEVLKVFDSTNEQYKPKWSVFADKISNNSDYFPSSEEEMSPFVADFSNKENLFDIYKYNDSLGFDIQSKTFSDEIKDLSVSQSPSLGLSSSVSLENNSTINLSTNDNRIDISYNILVGSLLGNYYARFAYGDAAVASKSTNINFEKIDGKSLSVTIYGNLRKISFETQTNTESNNNVSNPVVLYTSPLFSDKTKVGGTLVSEVVKKNILSDYKEGISSAKITICCSDFQKTDGSRINWSNGEVIQLGDIVQLEDSDKFWRVVGRNFRKVGVPFIDLELIELKEPEDVYGLYDNEGNQVYSWKEMVDNGYITEDGTTVVSCDKQKINGELRFPSYITKVGSSAFEQCTNLTSIVLGQNIQEVSDFAFYRCSGLKNSTLIIPDNLSVIRDSSFAYCGFGDIIINSNNNNFKFVNNCLLDKTGTTIELALNIDTEFFDLPESVDTIDRFAFSGCDKIKYIRANSYISNIDSYAFSECGLTGLQAYEGLESINYNAFENCKNLKGIYTNKGLESILDYTFLNCEALTNLPVDENTLEIHTGAFEGCSSITAFYVPVNVYMISSRVFKNSGITKLGFDETDTVKYWYRVDNEGNHILMDISNETQNAEWFKNTYVSDSWERYDEPY